MKLEAILYCDRISWMGYIESFWFNGRNIPLLDVGELHKEKNCFSILIGKNGIGKSRLLSEISGSLIRSTRVELKNFDSMYGDSYDFSGKVIAVTTSPFDCFKLPSRRGMSDNTALVTNYRYVGMRGNSIARQSAITLISSATKGIIDNFLDSNFRLLDVFRILGFEPEVHLYVKPSLELEKMLGNYYLIDETSPLLDRMSFNPDFNKKEYYILIEALQFYEKQLRFRQGFSITLNFLKNFAYNSGSREVLHIDAIKFIGVLLKYNLIHLLDLKIEKTNIGPILLRRASSGEQCVFVMMLGIAGHISDNSYIFIDEPEISLHPSWQEKIIELFMRTFSNYRGCHFFIATHSPQIISRLKEDNCFVISLENSSVYKADKFYRRSSDFQLAELFNTPGVQNEYITRMAFSLLSNLKSKRRVDEKDYASLEKLLMFGRVIDDFDPVHDLILSVKEVFDFYAINK